MDENRDGVGVYAFCDQRRNYIQQQFVCVNFTVAGRLFLHPFGVSMLLLVLPSHVCEDESAWLIPADCAR